MVTGFGRLPQNQSSKTQTLQSSYRNRRSAMASAGAAAAAAAAAVASLSSGAVHACKAASSRTSVAPKASSRLGYIRCSSSLNRSSTGKIQALGNTRQKVSSAVRTSQPIRAQANDLATAEEPSSPATSQKTTYYYLIANAKFMLDDEEHFQEQMQEKLRLYGERNKEQDFWIVIEPEFLDKHPEVAARVGRPAVALVSTDKVWITFMKLRLDKVLKGEINVDSPREALAGKLTTVKFEKPEKWIAVYPKYEGDWWTPFLYKAD